MTGRIVYYFIISHAKSSAHPKHHPAPIVLQISVLMKILRAGGQTKGFFQECGRQ